MSGKWKDGLLILLCAAIPPVFLRPFQNLPFVDDWVYAWAVEWLLKHGQLRILEYSTSINVLQVLWGALFCLPFGFSFAALRVSTWVLSILCLWGLYLTLREFMVPRFHALIGTAVLAVYPIYFVLSFSFMTDVPFLAAVVWFCYALARAVRTRDDRWLIGSAVFASLAVGVRLLGVALPVVMWLVLIQANGWKSQKLRLLLPLIPLLFFVFLAFWHQSHVQVSADLTWIKNAPANRVLRIRESGLQILPQMSLCSLTFIIGALGVALAPLTLASFQRAQRATAAIVLGVLAVIVAAQSWLKYDYVAPLKSGAMWSFQELGATKPLVPGYQSAVLASWWDWTWMAVTLLLGAMAVAGIYRRKRQTGEATLLWLMTGQFLLIAILWLVYDRCALVFVPAAITLLLIGRPNLRPAISLVLIAGFACVSMIGLRDHLEYNRALWTAVDYLRKSGASESEILGGYIVNGWLQYAHPENAPRDENGKPTVPAVTSGAVLRYQVSNSQESGWKLLTSVPYRQWLASSGSLYVQERPAGYQPPRRKKKHG
jgi:hypothetical protein